MKWQRLVPKIIKIHAKKNKKKTIAAAFTFFKIRTTAKKGTKIQIVVFGVLSWLAQICV